MVKHGLLSPNSKLLPKASIERPGSVMSMVSVMTKSGLMKDDRDTPKRRHRHRDGKTLRGGLGLTTGLGWSDSEDEDAPSALTRRVSTLTMSRRPSVASVRSVRSLSHSTSALSLLEEDTDEEYPSSAPRKNSGPSHPPSAMRKGILSTTSTRSSIGSATSSRSSYNNTPYNMIRRTASDISSDAAYPSSSSSTASIPPPVTPVGIERDPRFSPPMSPTSLAYTEKSLPALPSCLVKSSHNSAPKSAPVFRPRTQSNASSVSSNGQRQSILATPPPTPKVMKAPASYVTTPRPLKLVQSKSIPNITRSISFSPETSTGSSTGAPSRPTGGAARSVSSGSAVKPKPRIGAGMTYKTSGSQMAVPRAYSAGPPSPAAMESRMRVPSSLRTPSRTAYEPTGIAI